MVVEKGSLQGKCRVFVRVLPGFAGIQRSWIGGDRRGCKWVPHPPTKIKFLNLKKFFARFFAAFSK